MKFNGFINQRYKKFEIDEHGNKKVVDGKNSFTLDQVKGWDGSLGMIVPEGMVVIDVDNKDEGQALINIVKDKEIKCLISESKRGYHFYFRIPDGMKIKNNTHVSTPLGLVQVDYRSGQAQSLIIEYRNGEWSNWIMPPAEKNGEFSIDPFADLEPLPYFLYPLKSNLTSFCGMDEGDGRNDTLNTHRTRLVALYNYNQQQINELFDLINRFVFARPLPHSELATLSEFRDVDRKQKDDRWFDEKNHFNHNELGEFLIENMSAFRDESNQTYYFNNEFYSMDDRVIEEKIVELCPQLQTRQRKEVMDYIKLAKIRHPFTPEQYHSYVCCKNCLVDGKTGNTMGFTPSIFVTSQLDVTYDPLAYDPYVDKFLNEVLVEKGDKEQRMIFEEYLGYTLISGDNWQKKMLFCIGPNADNGKSTTLAMVENMLTQKNYSTVKLNQISESNAHVLAELCDKQANFDDDADNSIIKGSTMSYLKTIISDENKITINPKYKLPFKKFIRAKFWVATNHIIKTEQKGNEWMTRLVLLAFNNQFKGDKRDPFIKKKLTTESAKSYLLKLAIEGYQRLLKNGEFTHSNESEKWIKQYKIENDTVYKYLFARSYKPADVDSKTLKSLHLDYKNYCEDEEIKLPVGLNVFEKRVLEYYNGEVNIEVINNERIVKMNTTL